MLTKSDLQAIGSIVDEKLEAQLMDYPTKTDLDNRLKGFATKDDLKGFATKDDLKGFATKDDLKGFATKDDIDIKLKKALRGVVRKKDLKAMEKRIIRKINLVSDSMDSRVLNLEKNTDRIENHLHLTPIT